MQVWISFIAVIISLIMGFKYSIFFDNQFILGSFWLGCALLIMGIWLIEPSTMAGIIYWIITISFLATGIIGYLFGEDSPAAKIAFAPIFLIIGVPLLFLLIGGLLSGLLGGLSNSNSTKNTTYSVKGTFDGKNFEAKAEKDK